MPNVSLFCHDFTLLTGQVALLKLQISNIFNFSLILHSISRKVTKFLCEVIGKDLEGGGYDPSRAFRTQLGDCDVRGNMPRLQIHLMLHASIYLQLVSQRHLRDKLQEKLYRVTLA